ncbi:endomucin isoform X3 [Malaclemys terrapin pileata]|uniref:endomucin isoform X3 n=1 Tax=Malaclemys terrapin pileata TaxID=2991368 RepID=UPI0023A8667D|nr:endomucin isoform X3 [Malaclemys terrapin pileata]
MKLLGAAFLSLAVFSICTANVQENSSMTPPSKNTQWTPAQENSSMTPTSKNSQSNTVSSDSTFTIRSSTNVSAQENSSMTPPSKNIQSITTQENSSMPPTSKNSQSTTAQENSSMTPTSKNIQSTTVSSDSTITISSSTNVSAGKTESLPGSSVMAASDSTRMTAGSHWTSTLTPSHGSPGSNDKQADNDQYSGIILPVVIALIVITLSVFILVALIRMCRRTTTEGQENGTEQATTDKEGVKLLSVKTASPETGEHSSQGKNRTHQHDESSSHLGNKYM